MDAAQLRTVAQKIMTPGKGILATDGRSEGMQKRFESAGIEYSEELDKKFRSLFYTTEGIENYISGVILNETTVDWQTPDGTNFAKLLENKGILPGVKVDKGVVDIANFSDEKVTEGIDNLRQRFTDLSAKGIKFAKWRAVFLAEDGKPSQPVITSNCDLMARYAALCQECGLVPIVEPEVLMDGSHTIEQTSGATVKVLKTFFNYLFEHKVIMNTVILKVNMAVPGKESQIETPDVVAVKTLEMLHAGASVGLAGIVFLSGGQDAIEATKNLNAIAKKHDGNPWELTFSFERALTGPSLETWKGKEENVGVAQKEFLKRAKLNSLASFGKYDEGMENE